MIVKLKSLIFIVLLLFCFFSYGERAYAGSYSYYLGSGYTNYGQIGYSISNINIIGFNDTQGFAKIVPSDVTMSSSGGYIYFYINYTLPDDGSYWRVQGNVVFSSLYTDPNGINPPSINYGFFKVDISNNTSGSFSGYSPKTATDTASTAASNSSTAATNATNAYNAANAAKGSADAAKVSADSARDYANEARNEIRYGTYNGGKSLGVTYDRASEASSRTWDTTTSKSAATLSKEARDNASTASTNASNAYNAVNNASGNTITSVRDSSGTALAEARQAKTNSLNAYNEAHDANLKLDTLQSSVTNIENNLGGDISPPVPRLRTVSGAVATSGESILVVLDVSDNVSSTFAYSLDGFVYNPLPVNKVISLPVTSPGPNAILVWVKDQAGNVGTTSITIRKL